MSIHDYDWKCWVNSQRSEWQDDGASGKHVLKRHLNKPVRPVVRDNGVVETLQLEAHGLAVQGKDFPQTATDWNRPLIVATRLPVGRNGRVANEVPAAREVIVDEILQREQIDTGRVPWACEG